MNVYWHTNKSTRRQYNFKLVQRLMDEAGLMETRNPFTADVVCVSICDVTELGMLIAASKYGKPVVAGGFVSPLRAFQLYADYTCVGEGYGFVRALGAGGLDAIAGLPNCATRDKPHMAIDCKIEHDRNPLVRVTDTGYYYYTGRGCPHKCAYCLLTHLYPLNFASRERVNAVLSSVPKGGTLLPMVSLWPYGKSTTDINVRTDTTIKNFIGRTGKMGPKSRAGIEFVSEEMRAVLAKPLTQGDIVEFCNKSGDEGVEFTVYMIAGLETQEATEDFFAALPIDGRLSPRLNFVFTYIDAVPYTPLSDLDIRNKIEINPNALFAVANSRNRRVRIKNGPKYMAHSTWRTVMQRSTTREEADFCWSMRNEKNNAMILAKTESAFPHLLGAESIDEIIARGSGDRRRRPDKVS